MTPIIAQASAATGTGTEWLIVAAFLVPVLLLAAIFWLGHRNAV